MSECTVAYNWTVRGLGGDSSGLFEDSVSVTAHTETLRQPQPKYPKHFA